MVLARPASVYDGVNCALGAVAQVCGAAAALALAAPLLTRWAASPGPGVAAAAAGSLRITGLLLLACLVCFGGGRAASALGGSGAFWAAAWAPLLLAHLALHAGWGPAVARAAGAASHAHRSLAGRSGSVRR